MWKRQEEIISRNAKSIIDNKLESQKLEKVKDSKGLKENFDQLVKSIDTESIINEKERIVKYITRRGL